MRGQSAATYHTGQGTYFAFHTENNAVAAYKVTATSPPTIGPAWNMSQTGLGSVFVTSTNGTDNVIVWVAGGGGDQRLHAYDGDTGAVIYNGGGANEMMNGTRKWNTGIVGRGHRLPCRQQSLCFRYSRRYTHSDAYAECNSITNTDSYSNSKREPYSHPQSDTETAPDSPVAPNAAAMTLTWGIGESASAEVFARRT